ncbi:conserved hypothetical protein [Ricinus communis]|uniref:Uncharacterized protein n=1 Tax=Ricinus communis TaxID=3988 RepID=B9TLV7_RICCO|nr:conserved hypothetical protein [Ricinus communis]
MDVRYTVDQREEDNLHARRAYLLYEQHAPRNPWGRPIPFRRSYDIPLVKPQNL